MGVRGPPRRLLRGELPEEACADAVVQAVAVHPTRLADAGDCRGGPTPACGRRTTRGASWSRLWFGSGATEPPRWSRFWFGPCRPSGHPHLALDRRPAPLRPATVERN